VLIEYVTTPYARADVYANALAEVFRAAIWHVEMRGVKPLGIGQFSGLLIKLESSSSIRPTQRLVLQAFDRAGILYATYVPHNVADRVGLLVGEM
jgi:hypothetical protein